MVTPMGSGTHRNGRRSQPLGELASDAQAKTETWAQVIPWDSTNGAVSGAQLSEQVIGRDRVPATLDCREVSRSR